MPPNITIKLVKATEVAAACVGLLSLLIAKQMICALEQMPNKSSRAHSTLKGIAYGLIITMLTKLAAIRPPTMSGDFLLPMRSDNQPQKGPPTSQPIKIMEQARADCLWERLYTVCKNFMPHNSANAESDKYNAPPTIPHSHICGVLITCFSPPKAFLKLLFSLMGEFFQFGVSCTNRKITGIRTIPNTVPKCCVLCHPIWLTRDDNPMSPTIPPSIPSAVVIPANSAKWCFGSHSAASFSTPTKAKELPNPIKNRAMLADKMECEMLNRKLPRAHAMTAVPIMSLVPYLSINTPTISCIGV